MLRQLKSQPGRPGQLEGQRCSSSALTLWHVLSLPSFIWGMWNNNPLSHLRFLESKVLLVTILKFILPEKLRGTG